MKSKEFRAWAVERLRGHWGTAVAVSVVGSLLGGGVDALSGYMEVSAQGEIGFLDSIPRETWITMLTVTLATTLLALVIGGAIMLGIHTFHINLFHRREARFSDLFSHFSRLWRGICMRIVVSFFILLWSLLLIVPGIIASYRYAMVPFLMAEFPDLGVMDAMRESSRLMDGNKWKLFCLQFSYIGWWFLSMLTMGIGNLWLIPYQYAGETAFYMYVTGRAGIRYMPEYAIEPEVQG